MAIPQLLMKRDEDQSEAQSKRRIDDESYCQYKSLRMADGFQDSPSMGIERGAG